MSARNTKIERNLRIPNYREYDGLTMSQLLDVVVQKYPDKTALVYKDERVTYSQFGEATDHMAAALKKQGLGKGDKCGLLFPNGIKYLYMQFAIFKVGAVLVPLNTRYRIHELKYMLDFSDAKFLFMVKLFLKTDFVELFEEIKPDLPNLKKVFVDVEGEDIPQSLFDFNELLAYRATPEDISSLRSTSQKDTDVATILFTSGTTGAPKGVMQSHRARVWDAIRAAERLLITESDSTLLMLPLCHEFGGFTVVPHAIMAGCKLVMMDIFNAEVALKLIEREKISILYGVPTMFSYMLNSASYNPQNLSSLRTGYMSGANCPLELVEKVTYDMGCNISVAYGMTEALCHTISDYWDDPKKKTETVGKQLPGAEIKIADDDRQPLPLGNVGEVAVKGENVFIGYYKQEELTRKLFDDQGFFYTGDLGRMDHGGYLTIVGRKKEMIIKGGFNVYPREVEEILYQLPSVKLAAVVGLPSPDLGEKICACIVPQEKEHPTAEQIIKYCRKNIANYKVPDFVEIMDSFPLTTASEKIQKFKLIEILQNKYLGKV